MSKDTQEAKVIDWKETKLFQNCIDNRIKPYNYSLDKKYFTEKEIDHVIKMMQKPDKSSEIKKYTKGLYLKSALTLYKLVEYCELQTTKYYGQVMGLYTGTESFTTSIQSVLA